MKAFAFVLLLTFSSLLTANTSTSSSSSEDYYNMDGEKITKVFSKSCDESLSEYLVAKEKVKLYIKADDDRMILDSTKRLRRWAIEAKAECTRDIPKKWEAELDSIILKLNKLLSK